MIKSLFTTKKSQTGKGNFAATDLPQGQDLGVGIVKINDTGNPDQDMARYDICTYTNHSDDPNVLISREGNKYRFKTLRDVRKGEELFVDYSTFDFEECDFVKRSSLRSHYLKKEAATRWGRYLEGATSHRDLSDRAAELLRNSSVTGSDILSRLKGKYDAQIFPRNVLYENKSLPDLKEDAKVFVGKILNKSPRYEDISEVLYRRKHGKVPVDIASEEMMPIVHGSELRRLKAFVEHGNSGYPTDVNMLVGNKYTNKGVMVHSENKGRATAYAYRAAGNRAGTPAVLEGEIPKKYIYHNNAYSGGGDEYAIPSAHYNKIKNIKIFSPDNPGEYFNVSKGKIKQHLEGSMTYVGEKKASLQTRYLEKEASIAALQKKQYWQLLKRMYGGTDETVKAIKEIGDTGIWHGTLESRIPSIETEGLKSHRALEFGEGVFFGDKQLVKEHYGAPSVRNKDDYRSIIVGVPDEPEALKKYIKDRPELDYRYDEGALFRLKKPSELKGTKQLYPEPSKAMVFDLDNRLEGTASNLSYKKLYALEHEFNSNSPIPRYEDKPLKELKKLVTEDDYIKNPDYLAETRGKGGEDEQFDIAYFLLSRDRDKAAADRNAAREALYNKIISLKDGPKRKLQYYGQLEGERIFDTLGYDKPRNEFLFRKTDIPSKLLVRESSLQTRYLEKTSALKEDVELYPHQERVIKKILDRDNTIIAHAVGSGKTLTTVAGFEKLKQEGKAKKALVVVPASLRDNYALEGVSKFTDSSYNIVGNQQELRSEPNKYGLPTSDRDYNIVSYELFRRDPERYIKESGADTVIFDELHRGKNITKTYESIKQSRPLYNKFIGGTGSVVSNKLTDVLPLIDAATAGEKDLTRTENLKGFENKFFIRDNSPKYRGVDDRRKPIIGLRNKNELGKFLGEYVDYTGYEDVKDLADMPDKVVHEIKVPISPEQAKAYKRLLRNDKDLRRLIAQRRYEYLRDDEMSRVYNKMIEARKIMNDIGAVRPGEPVHETVEQSPKTKTLLDDTANYLEDNPEGRVLLTSFLVRGGTDALEAGLQNRGIEYGKFIGKGNEGVTEETRQQAVKDFNAGKLRALVLSSAGGEGLSLGDTTRVNVLDPHFNPERMNQIEARGIRSGGLKHLPEEERKVDVNRYVATMPEKKLLFLKWKDRMQTPDEVIYEIAKKKDNQNKILQDFLRETTMKKEL